MDNIYNRNIRIGWIDIAKCFGIFAIVLGHSSTGIIRQFCFSFNSAIFFILSGLNFCKKKNESDNLFSFDERTFFSFLKKITQTIIVPYLIWGGISICIYALMGKYVAESLELSQSNFLIWKNVCGLLYGNSESGYFEWNRPLWFLTCLICVEILWFFILKIIYKFKKNRNSFLFFIVMMLLFGGWMILENNTKQNWIFPLELETAIGMAFFFGLGLVIRSNLKLQKIGEFFITKKIFIAVIAIFLFFSIGLTLVNGETDTRSDYFSNIYIYIINATIASLCIMAISKLLCRNYILEYIGKRTMAILVMHKFPIMFFKIAFPGINEGILEGDVICIVLVFIVTVVLCLLVENIISRFVPIVFGRQKLSDA